ncbi:MAG: hypothetical protein LKF42_00505 [Streptococcaceae bacterium]|jgi:hypothetical protein|nr:hypothetical protein [Streptococcaceae bacterium]MCH4176213.1 hypothetical protein [Streptococcaceae bacterium]
MSELTETQRKYKRGWYRKGKQYRFLFGLDRYGMILYQSKSNKLKNSRGVYGVHPSFDKWFNKAEYIGLELEVPNE